MSHYVPKLLLKSFTMSGRKGDVLWEFDRLRSRPVKRPSASVGWDPDYYRVNLPSFQPEIYERVFARMESSAARILSDIRTSQELPNDEQLVSLLFFVALMYMRSPLARKVLSAYYGHVADIEACGFVPSPKAWTWLEDYSRQYGTATLGDARHAWTKYLIAGGGLDLHAASATEIHAASILSFLPRFALDMWGRNWGLLVTDGTTDFVAADSPCSMLLPHMSIDEPPLPSVLAPEIEVALPISRTLALVGSHEDVAAKSTADEGLVADINFRTVVRTVVAANRFVYAAQPDFVLLIPGDGVCQATERWDETRQSLGGDVLIEELLRSASTQFTGQQAME